MNYKNIKNVLVVLGGTSGERAVSLDSGKACIKALKKKGYKVSTFDPKKKNLNLINKTNVDVIFNALHGRDGEDGIAQSYFEYLKIPYTHSGVISSFNAMNKIYSKEIDTSRLKYTSNNPIMRSRHYYSAIFLNSYLQKKKIVKFCDYGTGEGNFAKELLRVNNKISFNFSEHSKKLFNQTKKIVKMNSKKKILLS